MASKSFRASDHKEWDAQGLDAIMERHEMSFCNERESGYGDDEGEWFIADDKTLTIISGTHGNDHSPGSSHNTYADVYDDEAEYRAALAEWEAKPEFLDTDEDTDPDAWGGDDDSETDEDE